MRKAYVDLHLSVFLFGFTAILGKLISLSGLVLVFYRVGITAFSFVIILLVKDKLKELNFKDFVRFAGLGFILVIHWILFFSSIKYSSASFALVCLSCSTFFTAVVEPIFSKKSIRTYQLFTGLLIILGVGIMFKVEVNYQFGIILGLISAFSSSVYGVLNKKYSKNRDEDCVNGLQLTGAFVILCILAPFYLWQYPDAQIIPTTNDWISLLILSLLCTTFAYTISLRALKRISAFSYSLAINLEPVYGILIASIFLNEYKDLHWGFFTGAAIILTAIFMQPFLFVWSRTRLRTLRLKKS